MVTVRAARPGDLDALVRSTLGNALESEGVRFGVNYTPSVGWFHHWLDFDLDDVRDVYSNVEISDEVLARI